MSVLRSIKTGNFCLPLESCGEFGPLWAEFLAVVAPGGVQVDEPGLFRAGFEDLLTEVVFVKDDDVFFAGAVVLLVG